MKRFFTEVAEKVLCAMYYFYLFLNGKFGKRILRKPYKQIWQIISWSLFIYFLSSCIILPIFRKWQEVVDCMNYVIWG